MADDDGEHNVFVLDTSALLEDSSCIEKLSIRGHIVVIPHIVLDELDTLKGLTRGHRNRRRATAAHAVAHKLEEYCRKGPLQEGVETVSGGLLVVDCSPLDFSVLPQGVSKKNDHRVILTAKQWQRSGGIAVVAIVLTAKKWRDAGIHGVVTLVTNDVWMRVKAWAWYEIPSRCWPERVRVEKFRKTPARFPKQSRR